MNHATEYEAGAGVVNRDFGGQRRGVSLRRQRLIGIVVLWLILIAMLVTNAIQMRGALIQEREERMITAVDMAVSLMAHYQQRVETGDMSQAEAQAQAFDAIREIRFEGGDNYIYVFGEDLQIRAHPKREQGQDVSRTTDPTGKLIFPEMIQAARVHGQGFSDYRSNFARGSEAQPRVHAFVEAFAPWEVYAASGVFMGDVDAHVMAQLLRSALVSLVAGALVTIAFWFMIGQVLRRLGGEPAYTAGVVERIAAGDLSVDIALSHRRTQSLLGDIQRMRDRLKAAVGDIQASSLAVGQGAEEIAAGNQELASRTEEQAAALEQTGGIEQINDAVSQLDQTTQQNAALVEQTSTMADVLRERSIALREAIQIFKL